MDQYKIAQFEFSHAHMFFWDKVPNFNKNYSVRKYELLYIIFCMSTDLLNNFKCSWEEKK